MTLKKKYGFWTVLAMTLTATVGSSIIISFSDTLFFSGSNAVLMVLAWILGAMMVLPEAFLMIEPSISYQKSGTGYKWLQICNWKLMAFWFGWILVLFVSATSLASCCSSVASLIMGTTNYKSDIIEKIIGIGVLFLIGGTQILFKNTSKITQFIFLIAKALPILFVIILAFVYGSKDGVLTNPEVNKDFTKLYVSAALLIPAVTMTGFAYSGTEVATYITEEIDNPRKTVPKTVVGGVILVMFIYVIYTLAILSIAKPGEIEGSSGTIINGISALPNWAKITFNVLAIILMVGSINALVLFQSRLVFKLSEDGDLFKVFTKTHSKTNQPYMAMLLLMVFSSIYVLSHTLTQLVGSFIFATIILKTLLNASIIFLRYKEPNYQRMYKNWVFWVLMFFSVVTSLISLFGVVYVMLYLPISDIKDKTFMNILAKTWQMLVMTIIIGLILPIGVLKIKIKNKI